MALLWSEPEGFLGRPIPVDKPLTPHSHSHSHSHAHSHASASAATASPAASRSPCSPHCAGPSCLCVLPSLSLEGPSVGAPPVPASPSPASSPWMPHGRHVFLCYKQPGEWPSSPFSFDWGLMPRALRAVIESGGDGAAAHKVSGSRGSSACSAEGVFFRKAVPGRGRLVPWRRLSAVWTRCSNEPRRCHLGTNQCLGNSQETHDSALPATDHLPMCRQQFGANRVSWRQAQPRPWV